MSTFRSPCFLLPFTAAALSVTPLGELDRPNEPDSLSSLTRVAPGVYWSSTDWRPTVYELRLAGKEDSAPEQAALTRKCPLEGATDVEGIARDPLRGTLWVADEERRSVTEHDAATGKRLATLALPKRLAQTHRTYGFESLALSPDGLHLWLANEEALLCDGPVATPDHGTTVRLTRFSRADGQTPWKLSGQWAYTTDAIGGTAPLDSCRSGLADLCALEDGTLLALEREYSFKPLPLFRCRLYAVDLAGATDVRDRDSLAPDAPAFTPVKKTLLYDANTLLANYEGIAADPVQKDGSRRLLLVSDGGQMMAKKILALKLTR